MQILLPLFINWAIITFSDVRADSEEKKEVSAFKCSLRVVGGSETIIAKYPSVAVLLEGSHERYMRQKCGGVIINENHVLTCAHCFRHCLTVSLKPEHYRVRVGSNCARSGGILKEIEGIIPHPDWDKNTHDFDIAIIRLAVSINYTYTRQPAIFANSNYQLPDNGSLWAIGWGYITEYGPASDILRHVLVQSVSKDVCEERYMGLKLTDNMMCSGWLDVGGRDHCTRDSGSPLYHEGTVVGLSSMGVGCGSPFYPAINVNVSTFIDWMKSIAGNVRVTPPQKSKITLRLMFNIHSD